MALFSWWATNSMRRLPTAATMIWGTVFVMNTSGNNYQRLYSFGGKTNNGDGAKPIDNVILVNGWLYGMTTEGGAHNQGTIFKVSPSPSRSRPTPGPRPTPPPPLK